MAKSVVVFGDSISAAYGIEVQQGWVALLKSKLNDLHSPYQIINESISGETSAGGLVRIDQVLNRYKPELLLLELGANDGLRGLSISQLQTNLTEIIKHCERNGTQVILLGMKIPPNYGKRYVDLFNAVFPQLASQLQLPFLPFILEDVALNPALMQTDGLHPNALAQPNIAEKVWQFLKDFLK